MASTNTCTNRRCSGHAIISPKVSQYETKSYPLSYRDLEEMMAERGLALDHSTVPRSVLRFAPVLNDRIRSEMRRPNRSWRCDETYIRVAGQRTYLYWAIDPAGNTIVPALTAPGFHCRQSFLQVAVAQAGRIQPR